MTIEKILEALSNVQEPDLGKDLVTLNMVKDIEISGNNVSFTVVLTTPACPMKDMISNACVNAIKILVNKEANVKVNFTSNTTTKRNNISFLDLYYCMFINNGYYINVRNYYYTYSSNNK